MKINLGKVSPGQGRQEKIEGESIGERKRDERGRERGVKERVCVCAIKG